MSAISDAYRTLPSVERLVGLAQAALTGPNDRSVIVQVAREVLALARNRIQAGEYPPNHDALSEDLLDRLTALQKPPVRRVINATGVIIHTNLGRAPLSRRALGIADEVGVGYSNLEYDLVAGERGSRHEHLSALLKQLTGAEASLVVNNNAAAVLLALAELAVGREVVISRGELVEIGGGFRVPDVLRQSGARLVEVGTTNRTYVHDYANAITPETGALLRVHSSNFRVIGFIHQPSLEELVALARERDVPLIEDLGSGSLLDTSQFGLAPEPTVQASVQAGVDLVCFSGDKLLGGPQAGIMVGRADLISRLKRHPLVRALRPDKLTIAALAATLTEYVQGNALAELPVWRMIASRVDDLDARAQGILASIGSTGASCKIVDGLSAIGGGALPEETLPTRLIQVNGAIAGPNILAERMRQANPAIVARIEADHLLLDLRTVDPDDDGEVSRALQRVLSES